MVLENKDIYRLEDVHVGGINEPLAWIGRHQTLEELVVEALNHGLVPKFLFQKLSEGKEVSFSSDSFEGTGTITYKKQEYHVRFHEVVSATEANEQGFERYRVRVKNRNEFWGILYNLANREGSIRLEDDLIVRFTSFGNSNDKYSLTAYKLLPGEEDQRDEKDLGEIAVFGQEGPPILEQYFLTFKVKNSNPLYSIAKKLIDSINRTGILETFRDLPSALHVIKDRQYNIRGLLEDIDSKGYCKLVSTKEDGIGLITRRDSEREGKRPLVEYRLYAPPIADVKYFGKMQKMKLVFEGTLNEVCDHCKELGYEVQIATDLGGKPDQTPSIILTHKQNKPIPLIVLPTFQNSYDKSFRIYIPLEKNPQAQIKAVANG